MSQNQVERTETGPIDVVVQYVRGPIEIKGTCWATTKISKEKMAPIEATVSRTFHLSPDLTQVCISFKNEDENLEGSMIFSRE